MKVTVTLELRFDVLPDGSVWTLSNFHEKFWDRYLEIFDQVEIVARASYIQTKPNGAKRVDGNSRIIFNPLPLWIGPAEYLKKWKSIQEKLQTIAANSDAVIMRVGSPIADILQPILCKMKRPYALEVVGDPYDTFAPGSIKSNIRPFYRWWFCKKLKSQVKNAKAVSYVTSYRLPERYPPQENAKVIHASSIELSINQFSECSKDYSDKKQLNLICVGALEDWRKGPDTAIKALKNLLDKGHQITLTWVGDGRARKDVEEFAKSMGVDSKVIFKGHLASGNAVFEALDQSDIFILPTRGEGLPRAMIEAMARGLVAVGSDVGGIPELINSELIHLPEDSTELAKIIEGLISNPQKMNEIAFNNWEKAKNYLSPILQERRRVFYSKVKEVTNEWQKNRSDS